MKLNTRVNVLIFFILILPITLSGIYAYKVGNEFILSKITDELKVNVDAFKYVIKDIIYEDKLVLTALTEDRYFKDTLEQNNKEELQEAAVEYSIKKGFDSIIVFGPYRRKILASSSFVQNDSIMHIEQLIVKDLLKGETVSGIEVVYGHELKNRGILRSDTLETAEYILSSVTVPVFDSGGGSIIGFVSARKLMNSSSQILNRNLVNTNSRFFIYNLDRELIIGSTNYAPRIPIMNIHADNLADVYYTGLRKDKINAPLAVFPIFDIYGKHSAYGAVYTQGSLLHLIRNSMLMFAIGFVLVLILLILLIKLYIRKKILTPIESLVLWSDNVRSGRFSEKVPLMHSEEFRDLGNSLNRLVTSVRTAADMENQYISSLEYQEKLLSSVLDLVTVGISIRDRSLTLINANRQFYEITGVNPEDVLGRGLDAVFQEDVASKAEAVITQIFESGRKNFSKEGVYKLVNGREINIIISVGIITLDDQQYSITALTDISELASIKNVQSEQEQMLIQQSKLASMGEMISNIAHQWRQPLGHLSGIFLNIQSKMELDMLDDNYLSKAVVEGNKSLKYMSATIDDFRNFYQPNRVKEFFSVNAVVEKTLSLVRSMLKNNGIALDVAYKKDFTVEGYPNEFAQVILNIVSNAKDILLERAVTEPVIKVVVTEEQEKALIIIEDNGGGIKVSDKDKIFEPYFSGKSTGDSVGIGLYMSKVIIEQKMNGRIMAENIENGARFTVEI